MAQTWPNSLPAGEFSDPGVLWWTAGPVVPSLGLRWMYVALCIMPRSVVARLWMDPDDAEDLALHEHVDLGGEA